MVGASELTDVDRCRCGNSNDGSVKGVGNKQGDLSHYASISIELSDGKHVGMSRYVLFMSEVLDRSHQLW